MQPSQDQKQTSGSSTKWKLFALLTAISAVWNILNFATKYQDGLPRTLNGGDDPSPGHEGGAELIRLSPFFIGVLITWVWNLVERASRDSSRVDDELDLEEEDNKGWKFNLAIAGFSPKNQHTKLFSGVLPQYDPRSPVLHGHKPSDGVSSTTSADQTPASVTQPLLSANQASSSIRSRTI